MVSPGDFSSLLEDQFNSKLPFVAFRNPNTKVVKAFLQQDNKVHKVSDYNESGFVFAPFDDRQHAVLFPESECKQIQTSKFKLVDQSSYEAAQSEIYQFNSEQNHIKLIKKGLESIKAGTIKKVVLSRFEIVKLKEKNHLKIFKSLLQLYKKAFVYCWYHPAIGLWLGATPETLLKVNGIRFETMALAGTQLYKGTLDVDWKDKEKDEQQFVTDFIVDRLKPLSDGLKVSAVETLKAGNVLHLLTRISGALKLDKYNFKNLISVLHPTPAICGIPRSLTKQFILDNEHYNREYYTGFLGVLNVENNTELFVNLRCMQLKDKNAIIYVGGGITKDSIPENEWMETVNKTNTIKNVLL